MSTARPTGTATMVAAALALAWAVYALLTTVFALRRQWSYLGDQTPAFLAADVMWYAGLAIAVLGGVAGVVVLATRRRTAGVALAAAALVSCLLVVAANVVYLSVAQSNGYLDMDSLTYVSWPFGFPLDVGFVVVGLVVAVLAFIPGGGPSAAASGVAPRSTPAAAAWQSEPAAAAWQPEPAAAAWQPEPAAAAWQPEPAAAAAAVPEPEAFFVVVDGQPYGPYDWVQLRGFVHTGQITDQSVIRRGSGLEQPAPEVPGLLG